MRLRRSLSISELGLTREQLSKLGPNSPLRIAAFGKRRARDLEHQAQVQLFAWAEANVGRHPSLEYLFAVPNWFGVKTAKQGARAKAEGRKKGVPDVWFPVARGGYHGLVIEMKAGENYPTAEQKLWLRFLETANWKTDICYSADDAIAVVSHYLTL